MIFPRAMALISVLALTGLAGAHAQTQWPPVQGATQSNPFPPPPGQGQSNPFPPPPGQSAPAQSNPFPPPGQVPTQQPSPFPATPSRASQSPAGASPFPSPGGGGGASRSICEQFPAIRTQVEKDASAIKAASDRKATREEVCAAFTKFAASESRMVKFLETNQSACGVPPDAIKQVKSQHTRTAQMRRNICAAGPAAPRGPSLSDALGGPILPDEKPKPGRGTFDTLTGSPLAR